MQRIFVQLPTLALLFLLSACSFLGSGGDKIYYNNGKEAHVLTCSGATWSSCLQSAGMICKERGYEILEKSSGRENGFFYDSSVKELVVSCLTVSSVNAEQKTDKVQASTTEVKPKDAGAATEESKPAEQKTDKVQAGSTEVKPKDAGAATEESKPAEQKTEVDSSSEGSGGFSGFFKKLFGPSSSAK